MKLIYLKLALKCDSFDVAIGIKIAFFRVLVTIELGRSLLQFVTTKLFETARCCNFFFEKTGHGYVSIYSIFLIALVHWF